MFRKIYTVLLAVSAAVLSSCTGGTKVAVVVDPATYEQCSQAVDEYISAISTPRRHAELLIDRWGVPDSLRAALQQMHQSDRLEGAVLVGDIPIPMIRDAQHLCTAFKMNQTAAWHLSSVPSDRYYDDFDLDFQFLKQDNNRPELFYYSLTGKGAQRVDCDIYTSRIKPVAGADKYAQISDFLTRAANAHKQGAQSIDKVLFFSGHGYNSDSMNARIDEASALREQFPVLGTPKGRLEYINHNFDEFVGRRLLSALDDPDLDVALLHHHGGPDVQYMNGSPYASSPDKWIELARSYFRGKVRDASDKAKTKAYFKSRFDIPDSWMDDATDPATAERDSLRAEAMDIHPADVDAHRPQAKFIMLDACFNGSLGKDDYMAAHYIFHPGGGTMAVKANTVNTLQDIWPDELAGLLDMGVSVGNWLKGQLTLESHIFGDPTFAFKGSSKDPDARIGRGPGACGWRRMLRSDKPELRCLAIKMLHRSGRISSDRLLSIEQDDPSALVRLEAFNTLTLIRDANLTQAIKIALADDYELTRRLAGKFAAKNQDPGLCPVLVDAYMDPCCTAREVFQIRDALDKMDINMVFAELDKAPYWKGQEALDAIKRYMSRSDSVRTAEYKDLVEGKLTIKQASSLIKSERNSNTVSSIEPILDIIADDNADHSLRLTAAEALGWYNFSYKRDYLLERVNTLAEQVSDQEINAELLKTAARLKPE